MFACVLGGLRSSCYVATVRTGPGNYKVLLTTVSSHVRDKVYTKTPMTEANAESYLWTLIDNKIKEMNLVMVARTAELPTHLRTKIKPDGFDDCSVVQIVDDWQRAAVKIGALSAQSVASAWDNTPPWFRELVVNERDPSGALRAVVKDILVSDPKAFQSGAFRQPDPKVTARVFTFGNNLFGNPDY